MGSIFLDKSFNFDDKSLVGSKNKLDSIVFTSLSGLSQKWKLFWDNALFFCMFCVILADEGIDKFEIGKKIHSEK